MIVNYYIDEYKKQNNGKLKRIWHYKTNNKKEFETIKYNLSDRIIRTYKKIENI